ncbi:MAG: hypothetical protein JWN78_3061 [Bacteroidota bacterium]|nr:hypothetical protein [Bacteroidota bacterium]
MRMEDDLHKHTELMKLQHILNDEKNEFGFLKQLEEQQLAALRIRISETMQLEQSAVWSKVAKVTTFMPNLVNAKVAETILDPMITANITYYVPIKEAIGIIRYLSVPFMAKVAEQLIPERCVELINALSMDVMKKLVAQLLKTKSHFTLAGFVDVTEKKKVLELSNYITKDEDVLRISHYVQNKDYLADLVEGFSNGRLRSLIETSVEIDLHEEIIIVASHLPEKQLKRISDILYDLPLSSLDKLLQKTTALKLDDQLKIIKDTLLKQLNIQQ